MKQRPAILPAAQLRRPRQAVAALLLIALCLSQGFAQAQEEPVTKVNGRIILNFQDAAVETVLQHLSEAAGLVIVKDGELLGRITVISRQPLSADEAVEVLNSVLMQKGFAAIRVGRTLKVVPFAAAKKSNIPVRVGSNPAQIAETEELITQVMPMRYTDASRLVRDLAPLFSANADITSNAGSNVIIMTDTSANVRRIAQIVAAVDTTVSTVATVRIFTLEYANATDAAQLINQIFGQSQQANQQQGNNARQQAVARMIMQRAGGGGNVTEDPGGRVQAPVTAAPDARTNTLIVTGPEDTLELVADVLKELDGNPAASQGVFVYNVRNGRAANLQTVLTTLFGTTQGAARTQQQQQQQRGRQQQQTAPASTGMRGAPDPLLQMLEASDGELADAVRQQLTDLSTQAIISATDMLGQVYIVADADTNSLLVMTAPSNFERVRQIIRELDRPVPQVLIKVLIAEVTHTNSLDLGTEFSILNIHGNGSSLFTDFGLGAASGGMVYKLLETDLEATIRALEENGKLEVLSRPYILASDNQLATITVGSEVAIPTGTTETPLGGTRTTIRYQDVGIILRVTPHINADGIVIMDIAPEISALGGDSVEIQPGIRAPIIAKRSAQTRVSIHNGRTIVIGGLMEDQQNQTTRKVPLLGDIPVLGLLFQRRETEKRKTELLIFLTPHVAAEAHEIEPISDHEKSQVEIVPDAVRPGAYDEHLDRMKGPPAIPVE